jgi:beta-glucosidase
MGVATGDLERAKAPLDFLGLNHYNRFIVTAQASAQGAGVLPGTFGGGQEGAKTDMGWEVWPQGLHDVVMWITREYGRPAIEITENGCAYNDGPDASGEIHDARRVAFYEGYLRELARAIAGGADVRGYHAWSLLDNFEWVEGYGQRFGLAYVDFKSPQRARTLKESGRWYGRVAASNVV